MALTKLILCVSQDAMKWSELLQHELVHSIVGFFFCFRPLPTLPSSNQHIPFLFSFQEPSSNLKSHLPGPSLANQALSRLPEPPLPSANSPGMRVGHSDDSSAPGPFHIYQGRHIHREHCLGKKLSQVTFAGNHCCRQPWK